MKKIVNNEVVEMTSEEVSAREAQIAKNISDDNADKTTFKKKQTDAKAGNDKLIELGLTQDQVTAMTGFTPPSE